MKALLSSRAAPHGMLASSGSVGRKAIVALSGLSLLGWSCLHLFGTLSVFGGSALMDRYAAWLRQAASVPLWCLRSLLILTFALHVGLVLGLWRRAERARPVGYAGRGARATDVGARWLRWSSVLLLLLIVGHVLHLSLGVGHPGLVPGAAYANLLRGLGSWPLVLVYVAFAGLFSLHLGHGVRSALVSLGGVLREPRRSLLGHGIALLIGLGFAAIPLAIGLGVVR